MTQRDQPSDDDSVNGNPVPGQDQAQQIMHSSVQDDLGDHLADDEFITRLHDFPSSALPDDSVSLALDGNDLSRSSSPANPEPIYGNVRGQMKSYSLAVLHLRERLADSGYVTNLGWGPRPPLTPDSLRPTVMAARWALERAVMRFERALFALSMDHCSRDQAVAYGELVMRALVEDLFPGARIRERSWWGKRRSADEKLAHWLNMLEQAERDIQALLDLL